MQTGGIRNVAWVPYFRKISGDWFQCNPSDTWIGALDAAVNDVESEYGRGGRWKAGVVIVVLWEGWGSPLAPCAWGQPNVSPHEVDIEVASEDFGAPNPWAERKIE